MNVLAAIAIMTRMANHTGFSLGDRLQHYAARLCLRDSKWQH